MKRVSLPKNLFIPFILGATFISVYVPTIFAAMKDPKFHGVMEVFKEPDVVGGVMGLLFTVLLLIGDSNHIETKESLDILNRKVDAQGHGSELQGAYVMTEPPVG